MKLFIFHNGCTLKTTSLLTASRGFPVCEWLLNSLLPNAQAVPVSCVFSSSLWKHADLVSIAINSFQRSFSVLLISISNFYLFFFSQVLFIQSNTVWKILWNLKLLFICAQAQSVRINRTGTAASKPCPVRWWEEPGASRGLGRPRGQRGSLDPPENPREALPYGYLAVTMHLLETSRICRRARWQCCIVSVCLFHWPQLAASRTFYTLLHKCRLKRDLVVSLLHRYCIVSRVLGKISLKNTTKPLAACANLFWA